MGRLVSVTVAMLQVPRLMHGVMVTSKGLVVGDLTYTNTEGVTVDCGWWWAVRLLEDGILTSPSLPPSSRSQGMGFPTSKPDTWELDWDCGLGLDN